MSMFTEFNMPGNAGPSAALMREYIAEYKKLYERLTEHISDKLSDTEVHGAIAYINEKISELASAKELKSLSDKVGSTYIADIGKDVTEAIAEINKKLSGLVESGELENYATKEDLESYSTSEQVDGKIGEAIKDIGIGSYAKSEQVASDIAAAKEDIESFIKKGEVIIDSLKVSKYIDFVDWQKVAAQYAGTGTNADTHTNGLYIVAKLSDNWQSGPVSSKYKSARAHIKYVNNHNFDAIVDMAVTESGDGLSGVITAHVSKETGSWSNLAFSLVKGTYSESGTGIYLAVSADGLAKNSSEYSNLHFYVSGINCIPLDDNEAKRVGTVNELAVSATIGAAEGSAFVVSDIAAGTIIAETIKSISGKTLLELYNGDFVFYERPKMRVVGEDGKEHYYDLINERDLQISQVPIGGVAEWPNVRRLTKDGVVIGSPADSKTVPQGWLACEAEDYEADELVGVTFDENEYPDLYEALGTNRVPVRDYGIVHARYWDTISNDIKDLLTPAFLKDYIDSAIKGLSDETKRAKSAESSLSDSIAAETRRAKEAESSLSDRISNIADEEEP